MQTTAKARVLRQFDWPAETSEKVFVVGTAMTVVKDACFVLLPVANVDHRWTMVERERERKGGSQ